MSVISRLFNFVAGTPAIADNVDAEFDQILAKINGDLIQKDGSLAFTAVQSGITPTAPAHLVTKAYADGLGGGGGGAYTIVKKGADQGFTTVSSADDTALKFAAAANTKYHVRITVMSIASGSTATVYMGLFVPAASTVIGRIEMGGNGTSGVIEAAVTSQFIATGNPSNMQPSSTQKLQTVNALITVGATAGDIGLKVQPSSGGQTITVKAESFLEYRAT